MLTCRYTLAQEGSGQEDAKLETAMQDKQTCVSVILALDARGCFDGESDVLG